jgi:predicted dehydrogenase
MAPLKIGILGAARIADDGIVDPSRVLGHRLVAVAARDRSRAEAFASQRGVERVHQTYAEVIDDPEVEVVYNALVDLGCYVLNAARQVGRWLGATPSVVRAEAILKKPGIDSAMRVELAYSKGVQGTLHWDMNAEARQMVWTVIGTAATAVVPAFAVPHLDNRIVITRDGSTEVQTLGDQTSYTYQLAALADTLQTGAEFLIDVDDSVANAELIDEVYRRAGLSPRGQDDAFAKPTSK